MITKTIGEISEMINGQLFLNKANRSDLICGLAIDSRQVKKHNIYVAIKGEKVDGHTFVDSALKQGASLVIVDDENQVPSNIAAILVKDSIKAIQELAKSYRKCLKGLVIGITGSNGKTSCKDILAAALSSKYTTEKTSGNHNNEIGVPLTILSFNEDSECLVVEMGMEQIGDLVFLEDIVKPDVGIVTNVGTAHLTTFGSMDNIGRGKLEMMDVLNDNSLFIYNGDDEILNKMIKEKDQSRLIVKTFGENKTNSVYLTSFNQDEKAITFKTNLSDYKYTINILGKHQAYNALAAIIICFSLKMNEDEINRGFASIENTGMRNELDKIGEATILNDAYKSNPQSAIAALETLENFDSKYKIVVFGDMLDLGDTTDQIHYDLGITSLDYSYDEMLLFGELSKNTYDALKGKRKVKHFTSQEEIVKYLTPFLKKECMILFKGSRGMALDKVISKLKEKEHE